MNERRTIHATNPALRTEVVRYAKAGAWYLERPGYSRERITLRRAVKEAEWIAYCNGEVRFGQPGGAAFDRLYRKREVASEDGAS